MYEKNFTSMKKAIKEELRRWKDLPCSWIGKINIVKMDILQKAIYRFNKISMKISTQFFIDLERAISKLISNSKTNPMIAKTIFNNKKSFWGITIPDLMLFFRAIVIKTSWYW